MEEEILEETKEETELFEPKVVSRGDDHKHDFQPTGRLDNEGYEYFLCNACWTGERRKVT